MTAGGGQGEDELVDFAEIVRQLGWPAYKVRLAMGSAGGRLRVVTRRDSGRGNRAKSYPLRYTLELLRGSPAAPEEPGEDQRVPFERLVQELGWSATTVRNLLSRLRSSLGAEADQGDRRRKLYPLRHTLKLLRWESARLEARRERAKEIGGAHWLTLSALKTAAWGVRRLKEEVADLEGEVRKAYEVVRERPPLVEVEIYTLPDQGLELARALAVLLGPLRLTYWKATIPEIPLRGEAQTQEEAVNDLRRQMAESYRSLAENSAGNPELWQVLRELVVARSPSPEAG